MRYIKKRKLTIALAAMLALMLALGTIAYAAVQSGILDRVFSRNSPGPEAEKLVRHVNKTVNGKLFSFTANDYILDGEDLYVDWTVQAHTDEPFMLVGSQMQTAFDRDFFCDQAIPHSLGDAIYDTSTFPDQSLSSLNRGHFYAGAADEPFDVTFQLALVRIAPDAPLVKQGTHIDRAGQPTWVDLEDGTFYADYAFSPDPDAEDAAQFEYHAWFDARAEEVGLYQAGLDALEHFGFGAVVEQLELTFSVQPRTLQGRYLDAPMTFEQDGYVLTVTRASFTGVNAHVDCQLDCTDASARSASDLSLNLYINGEASNFALMRDDLGTFAFWSEGGCQLLPDEITLVAGTYEETEHGVVFLPSGDEEMRIPLK